jgi:pimeloyl-ACP methyl ester carboxylesterase
MTTTRDIHVAPDLDVTLTEAGTGRPMLVLHGGGGPQTVAPLVGHYAETRHVLTPTHPGWNGTPRPDRLARIEDLAAVYLDFLRQEDLGDVVVIGSSLGGWIAADMATRDDDHRIARLILIDSVGVDIEGQPIRDFFALDPRGVAEYSFHDSDRFYMDPATVPPEQVARQRANMTTMRTMAGDPYMHDPSLLARLALIRVLTVVVWGESDRIVTPGYGRAMADRIGDATFQVIAEAGHLPQIEQPASTFAAIDAFLASSGSSAEVSGAQRGG